MLRVNNSITPKRRSINTVSKTATNSTLKIAININQIDVQNHSNTLYRNYYDVLSINRLSDDKRHGET